jgi:acyl dehydratase
MATVLKQPGLGPEAFREASEMLGKEVRVQRWNEQASKDVVRHYAWGLGDDNPLYCDEAYAKKTKYGRIVAPPTFLYSVFDAVVGPGLPDVQWYYSGTDWTFTRPILQDEEILCRAILKDVKEVSGKTVNRMYIQTGEVTYSTPKGETLAVALSHTFRVARKHAEGGLHYEMRDKHVYKPDEIAAIEKAVMNEERRGAKTRYFEDVTVGEVLPGTVKGPISQMDMTAYYMGCPGSTGYKSTKLRWQFNHWARHDPNRIPNNYDKSYYAAAVSPSIGHQDPHIAKEELGMPGPYDNGPQRIGMMTTAVTNWMSDDGFVRALGVRLKLPVIYGDTTFCKGKVQAKREEKGKGLIDLDLWAENQLGWVTARGTATVELPRKGR